MKSFSRPPKRATSLSPLPTDPKVSWPPAMDVFTTIREHAAWYSGDPHQLADFYGDSANNTKTRGDWWNRFWRRQSGNQSLFPKKQMHIPIAGDIASTSADLLFAEAPSFKIPEAEKKEGQQSTSASPTQDRLEEIVEDGGIHNSLLEAADLASGLGGVYLRPTWDAEISPRPILTLVHHDRAVPDFRFGVLVGVTFWEVIAIDGTTYWRYLERHEAGTIEYGLYEGPRSSREEASSRCPG